MADAFKPLSAGLNGVLADLERRAEATLELADRVRAALPGPEKDHVLSAVYRGDTLVVIADSGAWATHIRYAQQTVLAHLHGAGETHITKVKVKVGRPVGQGARR